MEFHDRLDRRAIEDDAVVTLANDTHDGAQPQPRLNAIPALTIGQGRNDCSPSPRPSPVDVSGEPKYLKINEHKSLRVNSPPRTRAHPARPGPVSLEKQGRNSVKQRSGAVKMQKQRIMSAIVHGDFRLRPGTKSRTCAWVQRCCSKAWQCIKETAHPAWHRTVIRWEAISGDFCTAYRVDRHHRHGVKRGRQELG